MATANKTNGLGLFKRPVVWGLLLSIAFYVVIELPQFEGSPLRKYTTEHATEYVIVILFLWGVSDLVIRFLEFGRERTALAHDWLPPREGPEPPENAWEMFERLQDAPTWLQETKMARRFRLALGYVNQRRSADGFQEYLQDLAEREADETHANYSFGRFIFTISPLLGLLGTVVHFGVALSGLSLDQLNAKLPIMVTRMGTAFNTTCVALSVAMAIKFLQFLVERVEEGIVRSVNMRAEAELLNRFQCSDITLAPFLDALEQSQHSTLLAVEQCVQQQIDLWANALNREQERWSSMDDYRANKLEQLIDVVQERQSTHDERVQSTVHQLSQLNAVTTQLAESLSTDGRLVHLQSRLVENLELLHRTQKFDQALHSLTAAIHLLTGHGPRMAGPSANAA